MVEYYTLNECACICICSFGFIFICIFNLYFKLHQDSGFKKWHSNACAREWDAADILRTNSVPLDPDLLTFAARYKYYREYITNTSIREKSNSNTV